MTTSGSARSGRHPATGRAQTVLVWIVVFILTSMGRAQAAVPEFELDAVAGAETLVITVTFVQEFPEGFRGPFEGSGVLDTLVGVLPSDEVNAEGRPLPDTNPQLVALHPVGGQVYRGEVPIEREEEWAVIPFPSEPGFVPGTVSTLMIGGSASVPLAYWVVFGVAALAALAVLNRSLGRRNQNRAVGSQRA